MKVSVGLFYPLVLGIYSPLTSTDQRRLPLLLDPLPHGEVPGRVPASVGPQAALLHRGCGGAMFHPRQTAERRPQPVQQSAAAPSHSEGRHVCCCCCACRPTGDHEDDRQTFEPIAKGGRVLSANQGEEIFHPHGWMGGAWRGSGFQWFTEAARLKVTGCLCPAFGLSGAAAFRQALGSSSGLSPEGLSE